MPFAVACHHCGSRFALTDELFDRKVKGRVVTVRCKHCKKDITVNGVELASRPSNPQPEPVVDETPTVPLVMPKRDEAITSGPISRSASEHPPVDGLWVVSYADDDDRELTRSQIERALGKKEIDETTLVWRDGMDEWLALSKVPELAAVAKRARDEKTGGLFGTGISVPPPKPKVPPRPAPKQSETGSFESVGAGTLFVEKPSPSSPTAAEPPKPEAPKPEAPKPKAAKPPLPTRAASPKPPAAAAKPLPKAPAPKKREIAAEAGAADDEPAPESSGTPALESLTTELKKGHDDSDVADEILALGAGAAAGALGPPTIDLSNLTAPPPEVEEIAAESVPPSAPPAVEPRKRRTRSQRPPPAPAPAPAEREESRGSFVPWIVLAAAAAVAVWWFVFRPKPAIETPPAPATTTETAPAPEPTTADTTAPTPSAIDPMSPPPEAPPSPTSPTTPGPARPPTGETGPAPTTPGEPKAPATPATPATPKTPEKEVALAPPFDPGAASSALSAAAGRASACRKEGDPSGTATVIVTFAPSGRVTSANVSGRPFAGTPTGGCIAGTMRSAQVPAFSGDKVTVSKTVVIN